MRHYTFKDFCKRQLPQKKSENFSEKCLELKILAFIRVRQTERDKCCMLSHISRRSLGLNVVPGGCHETQRGQREKDVSGGVSSRTHMTEKEKTD